MPAIHPRYLKCTAYLYPSMSAGQQGERVGGTAFFVAFQAPDNPRRYVTYVVTNKHLVDAGCRYLRITLNDGSSMVDEVPIEVWTFAPDDDLAVAGIGLPRNHDVVPIVVDLFIAADCAIEGWPIYPGDNALIFGRLISHDGREKNKPVMRFGNVSMLPDREALVDFGGHQQFAFLVECRSLGGSSGAPTFVQLAQPRMMYGDEGDAPPKGSWIPGATRFLGVNCGHLPFYGVGRSRAALNAPTIPDLFVETSSGMAVVIPAWRLMDLLSQEHLVRQREEAFSKADG